MEVTDQSTCDHYYETVYVPVFRCEKCGEEHGSRPVPQAIRPRAYELYVYPDSSIRAFPAGTFDKVVHGGGECKPGRVCRVVEVI